MMEFLANNWGSLLVGAILVVVVGSIVLRQIKNHKQGKSSCGCGCSNCPMEGKCHK